MGIHSLRPPLKAIFFDRDGVLNHAIVKNGKPYPPSSLEEVTIPDDAEDALVKLKNAGFILIGATNQPDVSRGTTKKEVVESINKKLMETLPLETILVCYHDDKDKCICRKPLPGLLTQAADLYNIDLKNSFMIGDRWKDIEAGQNAGCKTVWLKQDYLEKEPEKSADCVAASLSHATAWILNSTEI